MIIILQLLCILSGINTLIAIIYNGIIDHLYLDSDTIKNIKKYEKKYQKSWKYLSISAIINMVIILILFVIRFI